MRKSDLIQTITQKQSLPFHDITLCIQNILSYVSNALNEKGRIEIRGFGNLTLHQQKARMTRNPKTGAQVQTPAKNKVRFKMGKELKERLNPA